jgi:uncharacterized protein YjhX (UPF0386 family)
MPFHHILAVFLTLTTLCHAQSADWTEVIWREPQVRYLLADMTGSGKPDLYRKYATEERDPDSREAIRLWDAGVRVVNMSDFERKWIAHPAGKDGKVFRVVHRGTTRTITGREVILSNDGILPEGPVRLALLALTLGAPRSDYEKRAATDPALAEALRRWDAGCRVLQAHHFTRHTETGAFLMAHTAIPADPARISLNSDLPYPEVNVRYFMADIALGGSIEFYRTAAERDHELGCLEAVRRTEEGYTITNLDAFERKKVKGKTLITLKGSDERISGSLVKLSADSLPVPNPLGP